MLHSNIWQEWAQTDSSLKIFVVSPDAAGASGWQVRVAVTCIVGSWRSTKVRQNKAKRSPARRLQERII